MDNQDKPKAVVIKTFVVEGTELRLTERGAVSIYRKSADGRTFYSHSLRPRDVELHAEFGCPVFQSIVGSPEWERCQENKEKNKLAIKVQTQLAGFASKAMKLQQAAIDQLKASGMTEEQAKTILKIA